MIYTVDSSLAEGTWTVDGKKQRKILTSDRLEELIASEGPKPGEKLVIAISADLQGHLRGILCGMNGTMDVGERTTILERRRGNRKDDPATKARRRFLRDQDPRPF